VVGSGADVVTAAGGDEGEPSLRLFRKLPATPALELEMEDCGCPSRGCLGKVHRQDSGLGGKAPHTHTGRFQKGSCALAVPRSATMSGRQG
jgi:hypothetical protein